MTSAVFAKRYSDSFAAARAVGNHRWLAELGGPLRLPRLIAVTGPCVHLEHVVGRHARPGDLVPLAGHLGDVHGWGHARQLHGARLDAPHAAGNGHLLPDFLTARLPALRRRLQDGVPGSLLTPSQADRLLRSALTGPVAFYKDVNPRNVLLTAAGPVDVDLDDLTLAPFGYDLAKLIVTLSMSWGDLPSTAIPAALDAYNAATARHRPGLGQVTLPVLLGWAEVHHALTWRYLGRHGYRYSWHTLRPDDTREILSLP